MNMKKITLLYSGIVAVGLAVFFVASQAGFGARQSGGDAIPSGNGEISGVVTSSKGPEAGVWVIAETTELGTKFVKIVVTDDRGRYLVPDLPKANYKVWVRGYGLVDSQAVQSAPGKTVNLKAVVAPDARAAAEYYPAAYWYALLKVPEKNEFPGTGPKGNGISPTMKSQGDWMRRMKSHGCVQCHQLGNKATREIPKSLGTFASGAAAWDRRIQSGQAGGYMINSLTEIGRQRAVREFGDWTDRIAAGEFPQQGPPRPQGIERNVVVTEWDWADPKSYLHDEIATDKWNPTVNGYGPIYGGLEDSHSYMAVLDPIKNVVSRLDVPVRDPDTPHLWPGETAKPVMPSPYWGEESIWDSQTTVHNPMMDDKGRVWMTSRSRVPENPAYCREGSSLPSAKKEPLKISNRQLSYYDPKAKKFTLIDTCFTTHHLVFATDANRTLWTSGGGPVVGYLNTKMYEETGDAVKSQGWTALVQDANGNGKRDDYADAGAASGPARDGGPEFDEAAAASKPLDPTKDRRITPGFYGVAPAPDGSVWGTQLGFPGAIIRLNLGSNPPETALAEIYQPPWNNPKAAIQGYGPRGLDVDSNGVVWTGLASGHMASFDRRKCKGPLNGPTATGQHCPEGWTLYPMPGPQFKNVTDSGSVESPYYDWVDHYDTLGLGKNVPVATGNLNEGLLALLPDTGKYVTLRVPYPMGFYIKGMDGRIDDAKGGWKGRGMWTTWGTRAPFHSEGGKGTVAKVLHFQVRPDPLAK
jgi:hypothetical protein